VQMEFTYPVADPLFERLKAALAEDLFKYEWERFGAQAVIERTSRAGRFSSTDRWRAERYVEEAEEIREERARRAQPGLFLPLVEIMRKAPQPSSALSFRVYRWSYYGVTRLVFKRDSETGSRPGFVRLCSERGMSDGCVYGWLTPDGDLEVVETEAWSDGLTDKLIDVAEGGLDGLLLLGADDGACPLCGMELTRRARDKGAHKACLRSWGLGRAAPESGAARADVASDSVAYCCATAVRSRSFGALPSERRMRRHPIKHVPAHKLRARTIGAKRHQSLAELKGEIGHKAYDQNVRAQNPWMGSWYREQVWIDLRRAQLKKAPYCRMCLERGVKTKASVADHVIPHAGNRSLFVDPTNLQSLCRSCHNSKTARDGSALAPRKRKG